ncbi:MAG: hypothetical protein ACREKL_05195 [Chthoniobacterales bacterium]
MKKSRQWMCVLALLGAAMAGGNCENVAGAKPPSVERLEAARAEVISPRMLLGISAIMAAGLAVMLLRRHSSGI